MNDLLYPLFKLLPAMWEKRWWAIAVAWVIAALGAVGVLHYKERYLATSTVYVDTQSVLRPLMTGLTVQSDLGEQAKILARTLLSPPNISTIIDQNHLLPKSAPPEKRSRLIQRLMKTIKVRINDRDNLYEISYIGTNPGQTLNLVESLVNLFVRSGLDTNSQDSEQALKFIDSQITTYKMQLGQAESQLKDFRIKHPGYSGQTTTDYYTRVGRLQDQLTALQSQLSSATGSRDALRRQLGQINLTAPGPATGGAAETMESGAGLTIDARLQQERQHLSDLLQRYTDAYPDVIATRQTIARLERQKRRQLSNGTPDSDGAASLAVATSPMVAQQLRINLAQSDANIASLQSQIGDVRAQLRQLQSQATQLPKLDERYAQLNRNYTLLNDNYQKLVERRQSAILSRDQDQSRRRAYFRIVDPPRLNPTALFPRRTFLIAFVLLVALSAGGGSAYLLVTLFPTFRNLRDLREFTERPTLGAVSLVRAPAEVSAVRRDFILFVLASGSLTGIFVAWTVLNMLHLIHYGALA